MSEACAELYITRTDKPPRDDEPEFVPTHYPPKYALNARYLWNKHGLFPNGRCYDDQDPALIDDIERINARFGYHIDRLKQYAHKDWNGESEDGDIFGLGGGNVSGLDDLRRG